MIVSGFTLVTQDERFLLTCNLSSGIDRYQFPSMEYVDTFEFSMTMPFKIFHIGVDDARLVAGGDRGTVRVYDFLSGKLVHTLIHDDGMYLHDYIHAEAH